MPTVSRLHPSRVVPLYVATAGASCLAGSLESITGSLSLVLVVVFTHFLGRSFGRLAAGFASLGIAGVLLARIPPPLAAGSLSRTAIAVVAAWLCAELVSRHPRQARSTARLNDDRKTAEFLTRTDEETYRRIVDCVPACVSVGGPTGELLYVNKVGVATLGRPMEEILGDGWMAYIHPDDAQATRQQWKAHIAARRPVDLAVRMLQHDGVYRWQRLLAEPLRCQNGDVINWYLIGIEIEDTVKAQQALAASEREARELLARLPGRFSTRTEHDFDFISQQTLEETGTTLENIQNSGYANFIHPDDRDRVKEGHLRSVQEKSAHDTTYRWAALNGNYRWRHSRSVPYFNDDGSVYKWYAVTIDIDDLYRSKEVIRERERQLNWLTETVPSLLWRMDSRGGLEYVNKRAEDYTGLRLADLIALGWLHLVHPDDFESTNEAWQESLDSGEPYDRVHRLRGVGNVYRWFQCKGTPMRDANGDIVSWYGLSLDVDDRQRSEDRLRQTQAELSRATQIATVAELSASIAHELNQPLTSVIANAQACKRWLAASPPNLTKARTSVESVVRDARSADETMQSIRALFKRQTFQKRHQNVKNMALEAVRVLREDKTRRTADIEFDLPDSLPLVFVDQIQIQQVLLNLITNGIEATENSGRTPKILIAASTFDDRSVLLDVVDNGSGIVDGDNIFDPFVTTKSNGMGIGLAVSRTIIETHGGRLTAANNKDFGATFSVVLPVLPVQISQQEVGDR